MKYCYSLLKRNHLIPGKDFSNSGLAIRAHFYFHLDTPTPAQEVEASNSSARLISACHFAENGSKVIFFEK